MTAVRARAQRLITAIRNRAFDELERERGELAPMALTMDHAGRIGLIAVYTGDTYPDPDNHLADLIATLKVQAARAGFESAATAHHSRLVLTPGAPAFDTVCVQYETNSAKPLRVYFPYTIVKKLSGRSQITHLAPVTTAGTHAIFSLLLPAPGPPGSAGGVERTLPDEKEW